MTRTPSRIAFLPALLFVAHPAAVAASATGVPHGIEDAHEPVRNVILMIADGAGTGAWTLAAYSGRELAVRRMPVGGVVDTRSASHRVTDSAAGATAYATGRRVTNRTVSVGGSCPMPASGDTVETARPPGCEPLESWFAVARARGKARGIVTTTSVVDATPAAFVAHSPSRYWRQAIARQVAEAELDVVLGGGRAYFEARSRADGEDLLGRLCAGADCVSGAGGLAAYLAADRPLVGLFAPGDMDNAAERPVTLPAMVEAALARLERDEDGFVALFETESTDNAGHHGWSLERQTAAIVEFDRAVGIVLDFARRTPGTLVVVTGDHETGGLSLVRQGEGFRPQQAGTGHTANVVPLFASGPGAERFGGFVENDGVGRTFLSIVRGWGSGAGR